MSWDTGQRAVSRRQAKTQTALGCGQRAVPRIKKHASQARVSDLTWGGLGHSSIHSPGTASGKTWTAPAKSLLRTYGIPSEFSLNIKQG